MRVSVVVTTYNRRASLERCLSSLAAQEFPADAYEIIVVADGCTDGTVDLLRSFSPRCAFRWFAQSNQGQPAAQNFGVAAACGELVLFMDDDCICEPAVVAAHSEAHEGRERQVVLGAVLLHPDSPRGTLQQMVEELEDSEFRRLCSGGIGRSDLMLCANSSVARSAALQCSFDPGYKRIHDVEAGARLWAAGYRPRFAPRAVAYELFTKSPAEHLRDAFYQGKFEVILAQRHPAFKPVAQLVRINDGALLKRALRKRLAIHAAFSDFVLRQAGAMAQWLEFIPGFHWIARRLLRARAGMAHLRGAIEETGSWENVEEMFGRRVPVLIYHNVGRPRSGEYPELTMPPAAFERQMRCLSSSGYETILPSDWLRWRDAGGSLPRRPLMLVFDDAYSEACHNAFPILERYGFRAACMVVTGCIGSTNLWDEQAGRPSFPLMTASEILEWSHKGFEFGGHTRNHPELPLLCSEDARFEIAQCSDDLAALLGERPRSFAYPFGCFNPAAQALARDYFELAFTTRPGILHLRTDPHLVPRISISPGEPRFAMWFRLHFGKGPLSTLLRILPNVLREPLLALRAKWRSWLDARSSSPSAL